MSRESNPRCSFSSSKVLGPIQALQKNSSNKYLERGLGMCLKLRALQHMDVFYRKGHMIMTSWWLNQPIWNILYSQIGSFPQIGGENKKSWKPPTRWSFLLFFCEIAISWCLLSWQSPNQIGKMVTTGHHYSFACTEYLLPSWQQEVWKSNGLFRKKRRNKQTHTPSLCQQLNFAGPNLHIVYRVEADYRFVHSYDKCKLLEALQFSRTALR